MFLFTKETSRYRFFASCPKFSDHDQPHSNRKAFAACRV